MFKYSKLSLYKIKKILYFFSQDLTAIQTANLLGTNRNTINSYYKIFREKILIASEKENGFEGELELDKSYRYQFWNVYEIPDTIEETRKLLRKFEIYYNCERMHQSLNYLTPMEYYYTIKNKSA